MLLFFLRNKVYFVFSLNFNVLACWLSGLAHQYRAALSGCNEENSEFLKKEYRKNFRLKKKKNL